MSCGILGRPSAVRYVVRTSSGFLGCIDGDARKVTTSATMDAATHYVSPRLAAQMARRIPGATVEVLPR